MLLAALWPAKVRADGVSIPLALLPANPHQQWPGLRPTLLAAPWLAGVQVDVGPVPPEPLPAAVHLVSAGHMPVPEWGSRLPCQPVLSAGLGKGFPPDC